MAGLIILILVLAFTVYCVADLARAAEVRSLSRGVWAVICLVLMPLGGILYLLAGKAWNVPEDPGIAPRSPR
jgi:Phospholipase_D-nuclease N-terminal